MRVEDQALLALKSRRPGHTLPRALYVDPDIYQLDLRHIFYAHWLFIGHDCELARPGDYITAQVGDYPILVVRDRQGALRAFHNTCRHRGSRICSQPKGSAVRLVCPYHNWSYDLDGRLLFARDVSKAVRFLRARLEAARLRERRRPGVHLPRRDAAGLRAVPRGDEPLFRAARSRQRQGRLRKLDPRERQLEARLGEQPRVLSLLAQPSRALPLLPGIADRRRGRRRRRRSRDRRALGAHGGRGPALRLRAGARRPIPHDADAAARRGDQLHDVGRSRRRAAAVGQGDGAEDGHADDFPLPHVVEPSARRSRRHIPRAAGGAEADVGDDALARQRARRARASTTRSKN